MRTHYALLLAAVAATPAAAQEFSAAVGYTSAKGQLGEGNSTHGPTVRLGVNFRSGSQFIFSFEGGLDFLDEARYSGSQTCVLPGGGSGPCFYDTRNRDLGRSLTGQVRFVFPGERISPYLMLGLGILSTRTHTKGKVTDTQGNELSNFSIDAHSNDDAIQGPFGAGVAIGAPSARFRIVLEGRATPLLHNYSGGIQLDVSPSGTVGVWFRP